MFANYPNAITMFPKYTAFQQNSLPAAALIVRNNSNYQGLLAANEGANATFNIDPERNYVIGSSLGGLMAREMDRQFDESGDPYRMGGFVTFASAHLGAGIVNGKEDFKKVAISACTELLAGPREDKTPVLALWLLNLGPVAENITNAFCKEVVGGLTSVFLKDYDKAINESYAVGASYLDDLNAYASDKPKMAFYGIEDEPVFWRSMQFSGIFGDAKGPNDFAPWQANDDQPLWNDVKAAKTKYEEKMKWNWHLHEWHKGKWHPGKVSAYKKRAESWARGVVWWETSNDQFKTAFRVRELTTVTKTQTGCLCTSSNGAPPIQTMGSSSGTPPGYTCMEITMRFQVPGWIDHPSDGIVRASSAKSLPNSIHEPVLMQGSSHFSNKNDSNTEVCLKGLYDGAYDDYFEIK